MRCNETDSHGDRLQIVRMYVKLQSSSTTTYPAGERQRSMHSRLHSLFFFDTIIGSAIDHEHLKLSMSWLVLLKDHCPGAGCACLC